MSAIDPVGEHSAAVKRLSRDLVEAGKTMSDEEARFLVDSYYTMQDDRKRAHNQARHMEEEPHAVIGWLAEQGTTLEGQIKRTLDSYTDAKPVGVWLKANFGIGPVIAAGLLAHIDITRCPTVGRIWRIAGLDPAVRWKKRAKRPWNANLRTLCWKTAQVFMKFSGSEECMYGQVYRQRKAYEARATRTAATPRPPRGFGADLTRRFPARWAGGGMVLLKLGRTVCWS
jgi:hypothetical protein